MDYATGQILASKNPDARRAPASLTKVMTDYVVSAEIANGRIHPDDMVTSVNTPGAVVAPGPTAPPAS